MSELLKRLSLKSKTNENGIYKFVPIESIIINKYLPYGIKLELEERYEQKRSIFDKKELTEGIFKDTNEKIYVFPDKIKWAQKLKCNLLSKKRSRTKSINFSLIGLKKLKYKGKPIPNINKMLEKQCKYVFYGLIISKNFVLYYSLIKRKEDPDINLLKIKNKIKLNKYSDLKEFKKDFRNLWCNYYSKYDSDKELLCQTAIFCRITENLLEEISQMTYDDCCERIEDLKNQIKNIPTLKMILKEFKDEDINASNNDDNKELSQQNNSMNIISLDKIKSFIDIKNNPSKMLSSFNLNNIFKSTFKQNIDNNTMSNYIFKDIPNAENGNEDENAQKDKDKEKDEYDEKIFLYNCIKNLNYEQRMEMISALDLSQIQNDSVFKLDINDLSLTQYKNLKEYIFNCLKQEENKLYKLSDKLFKDNSSFNKKEESVQQCLDNKKSWIKNLERNKENINDYSKNKVSNSNISFSDKIENKFNINQNVNSHEAIYNNYMKQKNNEFNNMFFNSQNNIYHGIDNKLYAMNKLYSPNIIKNHNFDYENNFKKLFVENNIVNYNNIISNNRYNNNGLNNQNILNNNNNRDFISKYYDSLSPISQIRNAVESPNNKILSSFTGLLSPVIRNNVFYPLIQKTSKDLNQANNNSNGNNCPDEREKK